MTDRNYLNALRIPTATDPLRILMSACLTGVTCGYDGTANGTYPSALKFLNYDNIKLIFVRRNVHLEHLEPCATSMGGQEWMSLMARQKY